MSTHEIANRERESFFRIFVMAFAIQRELKTNAFHSSIIKWNIKSKVIIQFFVFFFLLKYERYNHYSEISQRIYLGVEKWNILYKKYISQVLFIIGQGIYPSNCTKTNCLQCEIKRTLFFLFSSFPVRLKKWSAYWLTRCHFIVKMNSQAKVVSV